MKSTLYKIAYGLLLLLSFQQVGFSQLYSYKSYTHRDGLSLSSTYCIKEKSDGGILIGTEGGGITEYDGYKFTDILPIDVNSNHHVTSIEIVGNDIYFSSKFRGIYKIDKDNRLYEIYTESKTTNYFDLVYFNNTLLIFNGSNIYSYNIKNKKRNQVSDFGNNSDRITLFQAIKTPKGCILLTNKGNYIYTEKGNFVPLNHFLKAKNGLIDSVCYGYYSNGLLHFYNREISLALLVVLDSETYNYKIKKLTNNFSSSIPPIVKGIYNKKKDCFTFLSSNVELFEEHNFVLEKIIKNTSIEKIQAKNITTDYNGDYWVASALSGVFKISIQPFTKIEVQKEYTDNLINYISLFNNNKNIVFSNMNSEAYFGKIYENDLKKININIYSSTEIDKRFFIGTSEGIFEYIENQNDLKKIPTLKDKRIQFIKYKAPYLWVNVYSDALYKFDKNFNLIKRYAPDDNTPDIIYTGQFSNNDSIIYFGTSVGISKFDINKETFTWIDSQNLGEYCGLSCRDIFGTLWFTLDFGIIGISKQGEIFKIDSPTYFPSFLFYTLNTDNYGNLFLGTNKGLNVIQVNDKGKVLNHRNYNANNGFEGFETHTRSSFQWYNYAFVGTLEGMWHLDFNQLKNLPIPHRPIIILNESSDSNNSKTLSFSALSKNPKIRNVLYSYRIVSYTNDNWSIPSAERNYSLTNLKSGKYVIEVKSTFDGIHFSPVTKLPFEVKQLFLHSNALIYLLILFMLFINGVFYFKTRENDPYEVLSSDEAFYIAKYAPSLILFGLIAHVSLRILLPLISSNFEVNILTTLPITTLLVYFFLQARRYKKKNNDQKMLLQLSLAFSLFMLYGIYNFYISTNHILYGYFIILVNSIAHIVFNKIKHTLLYVSMFLTCMIIAILYSKNLEYDRYLLMIPMVVSSLLVVFLNIIQHNSVQHLVFISTIINKSNVIALAMNNNGQLKYVSKNISNFIPINSNDLIDHPISKLNKFVASEDVVGIDLVKDFEDGKNILSPLKNINNEITWIEWSCKEFAKGVRVLIGQDVSEKLNLQTTYEVLVENAEDLIYQIDIAGNFKFLNERFGDFLAQNKYQLVGKNISTILPEDYHAIIADFLTSQINSDERVSYIELPIYNSKNELEWFGQYLTKLYSNAVNSKDVTGFLVVGRNITEKLRQDKLIAEQQSNITSSINYAKRIQINLLPSFEKIQDCFFEHFIIYRPKDIVSGDFYWCTTSGDFTIIAIGDGTGHGVPGAFMSILGINLLNSIVIEKNIIDPGLILDELDMRLKQMLYDGNQQKINDGIEITICVLNTKMNTIDYACAGSKLIIHDGNAFSFRKGDNKHIGDTQDNFNNYITHHYFIENETTIYFFTDGYYDQFGGIEHKKYSVRRLMELLMQNISLPMPAQKEIIEAEFISWKADSEQTDDITIIGLRIKKPESEA